MTGIYDYWAKTFAADGGKPLHLLPYHGLDAAAVAAELLGRRPRWAEQAVTLSGFGEESLRQLLVYVVALHDLGKFSEPFQDRRPDLVTRLQGARPPVSSRLLHDTLGYLLWRSWSGPNPDVRERGLLGDVLPLVLPAGPADRRDVDDLMQPIMAAALGHHGKPPENAVLPFEVFKAHPARPLARSRQDAASFAISMRHLLVPAGLRLSVEEDIEASIQRMKRFSWWVAGFTIVCDWIGSSASFFAAEDAEVPLRDYWARARCVAREAVERSGLCGSRPKAFRGISALFPSIASPTPLQQAAAEVDLGEGPRLFILEDLTGAGKTEAALVLAHRLIEAGRAEGLFFALPTMATANAMDARVKPLLEVLFDGPASYLLTHSGPRLTEVDRIALARGGGTESHGASEEPPASTAASAWLADNRKKALLAELGVGTIDQALLAALQCKHEAIRLFGLHRNVLVVDEVHACDAYVLRTLRTLLELHAALGGSAILLSATLPTEQRRALAQGFAAGLGDRGRLVPQSQEYPLLSAFGSGSVVERPVPPRAASPRTIPVGWPGSVNAALDRLLQAADAGLCACWIRNSIKDALEAYDLAAARLGPDRVTLFHARFALGDRLRIEQDVADRFGKQGDPAGRRGRVVIATQVVEQSLDIDFDVMVSDLCPIDRLVQRAGRLQRHARPERPLPVLDVLAPAWSEAPPAGWLARPFQRTAVVYPDPGVLWRTARELVRRGGLALPGDARALIDAVYGDDEVPLALRPRADAALGQELAHESVAAGVVVKLEMGYLREGADWSSEARTPTRLGEPTTTIRLARADSAGDAAAWWPDHTAPLRWPLSQVSVARRLIAGPAPQDQALLARLQADQPFVAEDVVTVILREGPAGAWTGHAMAERVRAGVTQAVPVQVVYSPIRGLEVV